MTTIKEDMPPDTSDGGQPHQQQSATTTESIDQHLRLLEEENQSLRESESRLQQQYAESQRRERIMVRRLAVKEQEMQDYVNQIAELKANQAPGPNALRAALLDPAVNILIQKLKAELQTTKAKMEETQNELSAWKFTPDSNNGKRLMAKCRLLHQENEELGKMTSNGRLAKLEGDLALQKSFSEEVKKSQSELDDFLQELDEDVEGMQSTIFFLQQELKAAKDSIISLETEISRLKSSSCEKVTNGGNSVLNSVCSLDTDPNLKSFNNKRTSKLNYMNGGSDIINSDDDHGGGGGVLVDKVGGVDVANDLGKNKNDGGDDGQIEVDHNVDDDVDTEENNEDENCSLSKLKINSTTTATTDNLVVNTRKRRGSDSSDQSNNSSGNIETRTKLVKNNLRKTRRTSNMLISEINDGGGDLLLKNDKVNDIRNDLMKGTLTISLTSASNGTNKKQIIKTNDID